MIKLASSKNYYEKPLYKRMYQYKYFYIMLLPAIIYFVVLKFIPMYGITLAFKEFNFKTGIFGSPWVGLKYFRELVDTRTFWKVFHNTLIISAMRIMIGFPVPVILALLFNELKGKFFKKSVQTVLYLPHFLSWIIISGIIFNLFSTNGGIVPHIIDFFGGEPRNLMIDRDFFRPLLYMSSIWKGAGWGMIVYLAALAGISPMLYEAARIDGANRFKQLIHITWPGIKSTVVIMLILSTGHIMNAGFDQIFNLYSTAVYDVADIIDTYVYRISILEGNFSFGTAVGLLKAVINMLLLLSVNKIAKVIGERGLF